MPMQTPTLMPMTQDDDARSTIVKGSLVDKPNEAKTKNCLNSILLRIFILQSSSCTTRKRPVVIKSNSNFELGGEGRKRQMF